MRINNIQRGEIITTNRRGIAFQSKAKSAEKIAKTTIAKTEQLLPQRVIDHFGLDITKAVNYKGAPSYTPAPETLAPDVKSYFHMLEVDWATRIDPKKPKKSFQ